jgi:hypothetical protein
MNYMTMKKFEELIGGKKYFNTYSDRGAVAVGNERFVFLINNVHGDRTNHVAVIEETKELQHHTKITEVGMEWSGCFHVYEKAYVYRDDCEPFGNEREAIAKALKPGKYSIYKGYGTSDFILLVRKA